MAPKTCTITHVRDEAPPSLTAEQKARLDVLRDEQRRELEDTVANYACPRCGAQPGEQCRWKQRHLADAIHAPRTSRAYRARRRNNK